jgi:predicted DNA-binding protein
MAIATVQLNFRVPAELYEKLQAAAEAEEKSKTEIVRRALEAYLEKKN